MNPRDAFFATTEQVKDPVGRIAARRMISPYPPGVQAVLGERFNAAVVEYLRAGKAGRNGDPGRVGPRPGDLPDRRPGQPGRLGNGGESAGRSCARTAPRHTSLPEVGLQTADTGRA